MKKSQNVDMSEIVSKVRAAREGGAKEKDEAITVLVKALHEVMIQNEKG